MTKEVKNILELVTNKVREMIAMKKVLKFENYEKFDITFKRYMIDLTNDLTAGNTPDSYLQVKEKVN